MATLFDATLALGDALGPLFAGTADPGSTATVIVDGDLADYGHGTFDGGTLWVTTGAQASNSREIKNHGLAELELETALAAAPAAGDKYFVAPHRRDLLIAAVNAALSDLEFTRYDTSLTVVANQEEYTLPAGVEDVVSIEVLDSLSDPKYPVENTHWEEIEGGKIRFLRGWEPFHAGDKLRIGYNAGPSRLSADSDTIEGGIKLIRVKWEAAVWYYRWRLRERATTLPKDDPLLQLYNEAAQKAAQAPSHSLRLRRKQPTLSGW